MYLVPAWMFGSTWRMSPTLRVPGRRHDLHDPDRSNPALRLLIERRFLIPLRCKHQRIEVVLLTVFFEDSHEVAKTLLVLFRRRILERLHSLTVLLQ